MYHSRPRWDRPVPKLGTLTTVEDVHNTAGTKYSVSPVAKIAVRPKDGKDILKLINQSSEEETDFHLPEQDGLRLCKQHTRKVRWHLEQDDELENQQKF